MNGRQCQVISFDESLERYRVQFLDEEGGYGILRAQNLLTLEATCTKIDSDLHLPLKRPKTENAPAVAVAAASAISSPSNSATTFTIALGSTGAAVKRLPSTTRTSSAVDQRSPLKLPPSPISPSAPRFAWSYIFDCSNQTEGECLSRRLFGAPASSLSDMERYNLGKDTPLFLRNVRNRCCRI